MDTVIDALHTELLALGAELGAGGGRVSAAVYDTAQVVRYYPEACRSGEAVEWLLAQQKTDGGFGHPAAPLARDLPTLAAALALKGARGPARIAGAVEAAQDFLRVRRELWEAYQPGDAPVAVEIALPPLLDDAASAGLMIDKAPYAALIAAGSRRREALCGAKAASTAMAAHFFETWGKTADEARVDRAGGVGCSPAATAAWLHHAAKVQELEAMKAAAAEYLARAAAATGAGVPGVVPTVWPVETREHLSLPFASLMAGSPSAQQLQAIIGSIIDRLTQGLAAGGLGVSTAFVPDGESTAAGLAIMAGVRRAPTLAPLSAFEKGGHFCARPGDEAPSISATALAAHALALVGAPSGHHCDFLVGRRGRDGRWTDRDRSTSWLHVTGHVVAALAASGRAEDVKDALGTIVAAQNDDGGWGAAGASSLTETAHAVLATLAAGERARDGVPGAALDRAKSYLLSRRASGGREGAHCWVGKEPYRLERADGAIECVALAALMEEAPRSLAPQSSPGREAYFDIESAPLSTNTELDPIARKDRPDVVAMTRRVLPEITEWARPLTVVSPLRLPSVCLNWAATAFDVSPRVAVVMSKLTLLIFAMDDIIDGTFGSYSDVQLGELLDLYARIVACRGQHDFDRRSMKWAPEEGKDELWFQLVGAYADCCKEISPRDSFFYALFARHFTRGTWGMHRELEWRRALVAKGAYPSYDDYMDSAPSSVFAPAAMSGSLALQQGESEDSLAGGVEVEGLLDEILLAAGACLRLANDVRSYAREHLVEHKPNSISILSQIMPLQEAEATVQREMDGHAARVNLLVRRLPAPLYAWGQQVRRQVFFSKNWYLLREFHHFSEESLSSLSDA